MKRIRVIPILLINKGKLVKTVRFRDSVYVGDPINAVKIFNDKEVDELMVLDISATRERHGPDLNMIAELAGECFMPLAYGGGIGSIEDVKKIFDKGVEKISINSGLLESRGLIEEIARLYGSQSIVASIDIGRTLFGKYVACSHGGSKKIKTGITDLLLQLQERGVGEILVNSIERDGTFSGYDLPLIRMVSEAVSIPVIACGGAGHIKDFREAVTVGKASAVAAGSMFVFNGKHKAVLISYPSQKDLVNEVYSHL